MTNDDKMVVDHTNQMEKTYKVQVCAASERSYQI